MKAKRKMTRRVRCTTAGGAHALRHELDKTGALSRRRGRVVITSASPKAIAGARRRARHSVHHGSSSR